MTQKQLLYQIASDQWGLVTTAQARRIGIAAQTMAKMAKAGDLVRLAHGVYRLEGAPIDMHEDLRVAWLSLEPERTATERIAAANVDIVSHRSAALVLGLGDLDADRMEFTVQQRRQTRRTDVRLHRSLVDADDWALAAGLPTATPRRVIADLVAAGIDRGHLATVVRDAALEHHLAIGTLARTLAWHARAYGAATGDGQGLLKLLLGEAGIPQTTIDVVINGAPDAAVRTVDADIYPDTQRATASLGGPSTIATLQRELNQLRLQLAQLPTEPVQITSPATAVRSTRRLSTEAGKDDATEQDRDA